LIATARLDNVSLTPASISRSPALGARGLSLALADRRAPCGS
jgi:hypothetical protein